MGTPSTPHSASMEHGQRTWQMSAGDCSQLTSLAPSSVSIWLVVGLCSVVGLACLAFLSLLLLLHRSSARRRRRSRSRQEGWRTLEDGPSSREQRGPGEPRSLHPRHLHKVTSPASACSRGAEVPRGWREAPR